MTIEEHRPVVTPTRVDTRLRRTIEDPALFAKAILGHDVWGTQARILRSVRDNRRTAVKACHASGKTFTAAEAVLWWICRYPDGICVTTAPTWTQVKELLWGEIHTTLEDDNSQLNLPNINQTDIRLGPNRYAIGLSTDRGVRFQGFHGRVLIVIDEAPGVRADIWEAIEGIRAGGDVRVLAIGNPTIIGGPFYDAFTGQSKGWNTLTIGAFNTPNLKGLKLSTLLEMSDEELDTNERPYLTTRRWVKEKYEDWGVSSPLWQSRVMGQFPDESESAVIPLAWVEQANNRWLARYGSRGVGYVDAGELNIDRIGVDVGGGGMHSDFTVFAQRAGNDILALDRYQKGDTMQTVGRVRALQAQRGGRAIVDVIGIGAGVVSRLRELDSHVEAFNAAEGTNFKDASGEIGFSSLRAASWWNLREMLDPNSGEDVALPPDDRLTGDLTAPEWRITSGGKIQVEKKDDIIKRLGRSTDDGDAVVMAFWHAGGDANIRWI